MWAMPDRTSSGMPVPQRVWSSLFPPSFLLPYHFRWVVHAFQLQRQNIIGPELSFVAARAFDSFKLSRAAHEIPAAFGRRRPLLPKNLTIGVHGQLFAIVQSVHFKSVRVKYTFHLLGETHHHAIFGFRAHDFHRLGPGALALLNHQRMARTIRDFDGMGCLRLFAADFTLNFDVGTRRLVFSLAFVLLVFVLRHG